MSSLPSLSALKSLPAKHQPDYADADEVAAVLDKLRALPPLVFAGEVDSLRDNLASVARGEAFVLQGGDCAETFEGVTADNVSRKLRVLLSMASVMTYAAQVPVVKIGRIAGQYAKPRSKPTEVRDGVELPSYLGDAINGIDFTPEARRHDPARLLEIYHSSAATLNLVRAFVTGGFADLRSVHSWNANFARHTNAGEKYLQLAEGIESALAFMEACGVDDASLRTVDFFASHEGLLLEYEHALTRIDSRSDLPYDTSGHMIWIGERTRQLDGAHVELMRNIRNPIGIKLGPTATAADAVAIADRLDPEREPGRITFITRVGASQVRELLPAIIEGVEKTGRKPTWICDPMHGNTFATSNGYKTRSFTDVVEEVNGFFDVHHQLGTWPGGVHVELTGEDVTECVGGVDEIDEVDLSQRYETACDPRLNRNQSLELAFLIAQRLSDGRIERSGKLPVPAPPPVAVGANLPD
ncbi:class II 3-deoxy-7-phosphoheptulonate synthase [Parenemella sanctibonifatiensis]|uniref:Phospho-2-dehydro-3-deoxyheptonate aldolase n=1 Tax=Parenemella sanctibonifatiensis TaxID=2016505 RepID=A0A255EDP7_9ACTN|nr:3-deoxy-7-phosphoheptulonate synthase class II [Parenemella sanctibonifatiensis]OYN89649.1 3-deoxy-7-phosphoheptulonate synthase class II [Parenemella sanctibonifatiensis]